MMIENSVCSFCSEMLFGKGKSVEETFSVIITFHYLFYFNFILSIEFGSFQAIFLDKIQPAVPL